MTRPAYLTNGSWAPSSAQRDLVARVFAAFGFDPTVAVTRGRRREVARARHAACWVLRARWGEGLPWACIAVLVGRSDHSTASYAVRRAERLRVEDLEFRAVTDALLADRAPPTAPAVRAAIRRAARRGDPPMRLRSVRARNDFGPEDSDAVHRAAGSDRLLEALRREHPDRCAVMEQAA